MLKLVRWHLGPEFKRKKKIIKDYFSVLLDFKFALTAKMVEDAHKHSHLSYQDRTCSSIMCSSHFFSVFIHNPYLKSVLYTGVLVCILFVPILRAQRIAVCVCWGSGIKQGC